jgi:hypothetical protein
VCRKKLNTAIIAKSIEKNAVSIWCKNEFSVNWIPKRKKKHRYLSGLKKE